MPENSSNYPERFVRTLGLYGPEGFAAIRSTSVMIIGQGGVGAHASLALARSGIGRLILIDFDGLSASSLNRFPAPVAEESVGVPKVELMQTFLSSCCPHTEIDIHTKRFDEDTTDEIFALEPQIMIDAIDKVDPKLHLLSECVNRNLPIFSSMGSAGKTDASRVRIADISETRDCPLAGRIRRRLRKRGIEAGIRCIYSIENNGPLRRFGSSEADLGLPSAINLPGIFGYALAAEVCNYIVRQR